jgi:hypothetical protein
MAVATLQEELTAANVTDATDATQAPRENGSGADESGAHHQEEETYSTPPAQPTSPTHAMQQQQDLQALQEGEEMALAAVEDGYTQSPSIDPMALGNTKTIASSSRSNRLRDAMSLLALLSGEEGEWSRK